MQKPTIHVNGSSPHHLAVSYSNARHAVIQAMQALVETCPHRRDYYPIGEEAYQRALAEHVRRVRALQKVTDELEELMIYAMDYPRFQHA